MRHLFGFVCVCALGLMPLVGCETADNGGAGGTAGGGGAAGSGGSAGGLGTFTNAGTCASGGEVDIDCDYACTALGNTYGFAMILNVDLGAVAANSTFEATFSGEVLLPDGVVVFVRGSPHEFSFNHADVEAGATIPVTALSGATGADVVLTMEDFMRDFDADPEPFVIPILSGSGNFDAGASGTEACFNFGEQMGFTVGVTELDGSPTYIPFNFRCRPTNQMAINQDSLECTDDTDCPISSCREDGACENVDVREPDAGQVCFTIP